MNEIDYNMRGFIVLAEDIFKMRQSSFDTAADEMPETPASVVEHPILSDLRDLEFKLRSQIADEGEHSLGMEMGMQRAADMIDNLIRRHSEEH